MPRDATQAQVRAAYLRRARAAHPDIVGETGLDQMRRLNEAWALLSSPDRRREYDRASGGQVTPGDARGRSDARSGAERPGRADEPHWTGAAGPAPGRPAGARLEFGIYAGWSLGEVARVDRGYLEWLRGRPEARHLRAEIEAFLVDATDRPPEARRRR